MLRTYKWTKSALIIIELYNLQKCASQSKEWHLFIVQLAQKNIRKRSVEKSLETYNKAMIVAVFLLLLALRVVLCVIIR